MLDVGDADGDVAVVDVAAGVVGPVPAVMDGGGLGVGTGVLGVDPVAVEVLASHVAPAVRGLVVAVALAGCRRRTDTISCWEIVKIDLLP